MKITETKRLYLREITPEDAEQAYLLNLDPEVIQYTGDKPFESMEDARVFLENYDHYKKYGFGRWAVIHKADDAFMGWCGLKYTPGLNEYDIGFRFFKRYWNQGFATESAKACLELAFHQFHITRIVGRAMSKNKASIQVLQKIGLVYLKQYVFEKEKGVIYYMDAIEK